MTLRRCTLFALLVSALSLLVAPSVPAQPLAETGAAPSADGGQPLCATVRFTFRGIVTLWEEPTVDEEPAVVWVFLADAPGHRAQLRYRNWDKPGGPWKAVRLDGHHVELHNPAERPIEVNRKARGDKVTSPPCHPRSPVCDDELASSLDWLVTLKELRHESDSGAEDFDWSLLTRQEGTDLRLAARFKLTSGHVFVDDFWASEVVFVPSSNTAGEGSGDSKRPPSRWLARSFSIDVPLSGSQPHIGIRRLQGGGSRDRWLKEGRCFYQVEVLNEPHVGPWSALIGGGANGGDSNHLDFHFLAFGDKAGAAPELWSLKLASGVTNSNPQCSPAQAP